jgi:hypothetical protein
VVRVSIAHALQIGSDERSLGLLWLASGYSRVGETVRVIGEDVSTDRLRAR